MPDATMAWRKYTIWSHREMFGKLGFQAGMTEGGQPFLVADSEWMGKKVYFQVYGKDHDKMLAHMLAWALENAK